MAAAGTNPVRHPTRRRLVQALVVLSLALNLCFLAGAAWIHLHPPPPFFSPAFRFREMAGELDLNPQQRIAFDRYFRQMRARTVLMHEEVEPLIVDAWNEVAKPQADETQVMRLFDAASDKRRIYQREATTETLAFLATLTPEQRAKFVVIARQRHEAWAKRINHGVSP